MDLSVFPLWLVGCLGLNCPLRQCFSLYLTERVRKKREVIEKKQISIQHPPAPTASAVSPCPSIIQISRTPRHCKFTQHHRTTRPPLSHCLLKRKLLCKFLVAFLDKWMRKLFKIRLYSKGKNLLLGEFLFSF